MNYLQDYFNSVSLFVKSINEYLPTIQQLSHSQSLLQDLTDNIQKLLDSKLDGNLNIDTIENLFKVTVKWQSVERYMNSLIKQLAIYHPSSIMGSNISKTRISELETKHQGILRKFNNSQKDYVGNRSKIEVMIIDMLWSFNPSADVVSKLWRKYPHTIQLYKVYFNEKFAEAVKSGNRQTTDTLHGIIEEDKHWLLIQDLTLPIRIKSTPEFIFRYMGFVPVGTSRMLEDIYPKCKKPQDLLSKSGLDITNVLILHMISTQPIALNYDTIRTTHDENVNIPTITLISHLTTLKVLEDKKKWDVQYEILGKSRDSIDSRWIVLDTIGDEYYRVLMPWMTDKPGVLSYGQIKPLLMQLEDPDNTNLQGYTQLCNVLINPVLPDPIDLDILVEDTKVLVDSSTAKHDIRIRLLKKLPKSLTSYKKPVTAEQIQDAMQQEEVLEEFRNAIIDIYHENYKQRKLTISWAEVYSTYMVKLEVYKKQFTRSISDALIKYGKTDIIDVINYGLDTIINQASNPWSDIELKTNLISTLTIRNLS